ncbi:arylsulfatase K isoform X2 [Lepisosteus oculatus]|uniref:arylsulfatase K isoform X2 n=1 Tax=Lepisosteus oculatus TaxID=7918 RepID=UPI0037215981
MSKTFAAFLLTQAAVFLGSPESRTVTGSAPRNGTAALRPNIVLVMVDSFDGRLTFEPGNKTVLLPYISYMREQGAVFLNSYTNSPICCPSRAAMWSGRFVHLTESWNNYKCLEENYTTWMDLLRKRGYYTKKLGKLDYRSGGHTVSNRVEAWTRDVDFLLRQEGRPVTNLTGDASTVRVMTEDWNTTDSASHWIRRSAAALAQPFALYVGLNLPHPYLTASLGRTAGGSTFRTSEFWLKKVSHHLVTVPTWLPFSRMHQVDFYSTYTKNCSSNFTEQELKDIRTFYYAMCAEADAMLGEILLALRDSQLLSSTVLLFTSDHGELAMEHRQFYKMSMYEGSSHVPLLVTGPRVRAGLQVPQPVSLVDIYPTALDLAGIPLPGGLSGHSLLPLLSRDTPPKGRPRPTWVLSEFHGSDVNASTYMLRTEQWKYIAYADGISVPPQLFDTMQGSGTVVCPGPVLALSTPALKRRYLCEQM